VPSSIQTPLVGQIATYRGVYRPYWEIAHIAVRVSQVRKLPRVAAAAGVLLLFLLLGVIGWTATLAAAGLLVVVALFPAEEWWAPQFPPDVDRRLLEGGVTPIEFDGIVSAPRWYGYMGLMRRTVDVIRVRPYRLGAPLREVR